MMPVVPIEEFEQASSPEDPALRYWLLDGRVGVPDLRTYRRAAAGIATWLGAPLLLARLLGRRRKRRALHALERRWARGVRRHLDIRLHVSGTEHIEAGQAYIVTPLHEGFADALALLQLPLDLRFAARDELFDWRVFGAVLRDTRQVRLCPEQGMQSYLRLRRQAPAILAGGESLVIFPQGGILGIEIDFKAGPFAPARTLGRPILPVALTGSHRVWEHPFTPRLHYGQSMSLRVLPPMSAEACHATDTEGLRTATRRRLRAAALSGMMAPPRRFVPARDGYWDGYAYAIDPAFPELAGKVARHRCSRMGRSG